MRRQYYDGHYSTGIVAWVNHLARIVHAITRKLLGSPLSDFLEALDKVNGKKCSEWSILNILCRRRLISISPSGRRLLCPKLACQAIGSLFGNSLLKPKPGLLTYLYVPPFQP